MKILALDTAAKTAGLALAAVDEQGKLTLLSSYSLQTGSHSTTLLPMIESMLALHGMTAADVDLYAVSAGPGSFTGIRIGVAAVKGLAFRDNIPCVGVSSLEGMAMGFERLPGLLLPAMDARRGTVYGAIFLSDGRGGPEAVRRLTPDAQIPFAEFAEQAAAWAAKYPDLPVYGCGDAYDTARELSVALHPAPAPLAYPNGYGVALAGYRLYKEADDGSALTEAALVPVYLKKSQAEREREEALASQA